MKMKNQYCKGVLFLYYAFESFIQSVRLVLKQKIIKRRCQEIGVPCCKIREELRRFVLIEIRQKACEIR